MYINKRFCGSATEQNANRYEISKKRFVEVLQSKSQTSFQILVKLFHKTVSQSDQMLLIESEIRVKIVEAG